MKRKSPLLLVLFLLLSFLFPLSPRSAAAETNVYACATEDGTRFFSSPNEESALFLLPQSYYVKVLAKGNEYSYVQYLENVSCYQSVYGYCKTDELLFVDYLPLNPYLYYTYTVTYTTPSLSLPDSTLSSFSYPCVYYGAHPAQSDSLSYVLINGKFGYLPSPEGFTYERNTDYVEYLLSLTPAPPQEEPSDDANQPVDPPVGVTLSVGKIIAVIGSVAAVLLIACFLLVTYKSGKKKQYYYDD